jgi:hypothetical protein
MSEPLDSMNPYASPDVARRRAFTSGSGGIQIAGEITEPLIRDAILIHPPVRYAPWHVAGVFFVAGCVALGGGYVIAHSGRARPDDIFLGTYAIGILTLMVLVFALMFRSRLMDKELAGRFPRGSFQGAISLDGIELRFPGAPSWSRAWEDLAFYRDSPDVFDEPFVVLYDSERLPCVVLPMRSFASALDWQEFRDVMWDRKLGQLGAKTAQGGAA